MTEQQRQTSDSEAWEAWKDRGDQEAKKILTLRYLHLVDYVVNRLAVGLPGNVSRDDLTSYGSLGLMDALDKFDLKRGLQFETYASWRIRGSIIDGLRQNDWVPRSVREKARKIEDAYQVLEQSLLRSATDREVSEYLQMSEKEYMQMLQDISVTTICSLQDPIKDEDAETRIQLMVDPHAENPDRTADQVFLREALTQAIEHLTKKERIVISLLYFEDLSLTEISEVMSLTPSRISQLHSKAILRMRGCLTRLKNELMQDQ